jgi:Tol biopolymer transport system component
MADLYEKPIDGTGDGTKLLHSGKWKDPLSWSRDGFLLFNVTGKGEELWALPLKGPGNTAVPLLQGGPNYLDAHFSPDGHWVAYVSNESTRFEVYVKSFSAGHLGQGGRVSPDGGFSPRWSNDGKQLYYLGLDFRLMTMKLTLGTDVQAGAPTELFPAPHTGNWAPSPDGKRFLFLVPQQQQDTPLTVVLNWQAGLKK